MNYTEIEIQNLKNSSFNYALYSTENIEVANDISSETLALFVLSADKITEPAGWVLNTTKNYCKKYFESSKRDQRIEKNYRNELLSSMGNRLELQTDEELNKAFKESFESLSKDELKTIMYYFQCNESIKQLHENVGGSYQALRAKISRIKRTLKAETYLRLGYYGSKKIVTPKLDNQILKFLKRFKKHLEAGTLEKMYYYFSEVDIKELPNDIKINKIQGYDIKLRNSIYRIWVIYNNSSDSSKAITVDFRINEKGNLKVVSLPKKALKTIVINAKTNYGILLEKLMDKYPPGKDGQPTIPKEELQKLVELQEKADKIE